MTNLKARLNILESMARNINKFMRVQVFVFDGTQEQEQKISNLEKQGVKVRLFKVVE
jgi:hypothetical protein